MKIQSKSDIITNSSSEVFIILKSEAEEIDKSIKRNGMCYDDLNDDFFWREGEINTICLALGLKHGYFDNYDEYNKWCNDVVKPIYDRELKDKGYVFAEIDNQSENCGEAMSMAGKVCIYHEDRN